MRFEHFALNVTAPHALAAWYQQHLGFQLARDVGGPTQTLFLADHSGRVVVELYHNPAAPVPDYAAMHHLVFHFAVVSDDAPNDAARLERAGATLVEEVAPPDGSRLFMLRDPWGICVQLCQRAMPL
ncbi:MAG TPA: VOC family protein [Candidatus Synoicihabitans sp.]|nr:VOC family protein [Candidatus Synoicihabitans sp.]